MIKILSFLRVFFGLGSVRDGSICYWAERGFDRHDYYRSKGGDNIPSHFYEYECWNCGKKFFI